MKRVSLAAALVVLALGTVSAASAQTTLPPPVVFVAVDAFSYDATACKFTVTAIVQGEAVASDKVFSYMCAGGTLNLDELKRRLESCERMALLAMAKPGMYLFQVTPYFNYQVSPACKLTRVNP